MCIHVLQQTGLVLWALASCRLLGPLFTGWCVLNCHAHMWEITCPRLRYCQATEQRRVGCGVATLFVGLILNLLTNQFLNHIFQRYHTDDCLTVICIYHLCQMAFACLEQVQHLVQRLPCGNSWQLAHCQLADGRGVLRVQSQQVLYKDHADDVVGGLVVHGNPAVAMALDVLDGRNVQETIQVQHEDFLHRGHAILDTLLRHLQSPSDDGCFILGQFLLSHPLVLLQHHQLSQLTPTEESCLPMS
mmetsp:Transcript_62652/g.111705  ORF Transcript_62652/g.111705 Transcript_62652/m.111705 type:complete len:246 (+) Transcript_62652:420-1157(+)